MSKKKNPNTKKKKVIVGDKGEATKRVKPTVSKRTTTSLKSRPTEEMMFNRENYILMLAGVGLILLGLALMSGGKMTDPNVWDESVIYSFRRTVLAPFVILVGLGVEVYAIFK